MNRREQTEASVNTHSLLCLIDGTDSGGEEEEGSQGAGGKG